MKVLQVANDTLVSPRLFVEKRSSAFWPSEAGLTFTMDGRTWREGGCNRKAYYRYTSTPKDTRGEDLGSSLTMVIGVLIQRWLEDVLKIGRVFLGSEIPVGLTRTTPDGIKYSISGSIDFIVQDLDTGRPVFCELKTMGHWKALDGKIVPKGEKLEPSLEHVLQVMPYLDIVRNEFGVQDPEFNLIYIDRDQPKYHTEHIIKLAKGPEQYVIITNDLGVIEWKDVSLERLYQDYDTLAQHIHAGTPPPRPYTVQYDADTIRWLYNHEMLNKKEMATVKAQVNRGEEPNLEKGDFQCSFCPFFNTCYGQSIPGNTSPISIPGKLGNVGTSVNQTKSMNSLAE